MVFSEIDPNRDTGWQRVQGVSRSDADVYDLPDGYRAVEVNTDSTAELKDLVSLRRDLELAAIYARSFSEQISGTDGESSPRDPAHGLWFAALICYGRCFGTGVRHIGKVSVAELNSDESEEHKYLLTLRDKHIAHAVNGYEDTVVFAVVTDSAFKTPEVTRIGQVHTELVDNPGSRAAELQDLCSKHIEQLNDRIRSLHLQIAKEVYEMGRETVYALPVVKLKRDARIDKPRKRSSSRSRT